MLQDGSDQTKSLSIGMAGVGCCPYILVFFVFGKRTELFIELINRISGQEIRLIKVMKSFRLEEPHGVQLHVN